MSDSVRTRRATLTAVFHGIFTVWMFVGFIAQLIFPVLALPLLITAAVTLVAEVIFRGCPLTVLENHYRPGPAYGRYEGSFIRHYVRRFTGLVIPRGLVPTLIVVGLALSAYQLLHAVP